MMTNKEFYGDKFLPVVLEYYGDKFLHVVLTKACDSIYREVYGEDCAGSCTCTECPFWTPDRVTEWLNAEHVEPEPPLLENGDDLKPGDWIMVKDETDDSEEWVRRQFVCYIDNGFWVSAENASFDSGACLSIIKWEQARLPMEGE